MSSFMPPPDTAPPVAWMHSSPGRVDVISDEVKRLWLNVNPRHVERYTIPLCICTNAQKA